MDTMEEVFEQDQFDICISGLKKRGYNVTDEQSSVKWKNLKQKYRSVRDANNETGNAKVSWEYFDLIDEFMNTSPEVTPLSLASNTRGFRLHNENVCIRENSEFNDENTVLDITSTTSTSTTFISTSTSTISHDTTRNKRKRARKENDLAYYKQREKHHRENIEMQNRFLTLFKDIYKNEQQ